MKFESTAIGVFQSLASDFQFFVLKLTINLLSLPCIPSSYGAGTFAYFKCRIWALPPLSWAQVVRSHSFIRAHNQSNRIPKTVSSINFRCRLLNQHTILSLGANSAPCNRDLPLSLPRSIISDVGSSCHA